MHKQTITYTDFDNNEVTEDLWFNISKSEIMENIGEWVAWKDEFEAFLKTFEGRDPEGIVPPEDVAKMIALIKEFMRRAYGERPDARRFVKGEDVWEGFTQTAAYDHFLLSLFQDVQDAWNFLLAIFPADMIAEAQKENPQAFAALEPAKKSTDEDVPSHRRPGVPQPSDRKPKRAVENVETVLDEAWWMEREPTASELIQMRSDELERYKAWRAENN